MQMTTQSQKVNRINTNLGPTRFWGTVDVRFSFLTVVVLIALVLVSAQGEVRAQGAGFQKGAGAGAAASSSPTASPSPSTSSTPGGAGGGGSTLQGISFAKDSWDIKLSRPLTPGEVGIGKAKVVVICYNLVAVNSAAQPFTLESQPAISIWRPNHKYNEGDLITPTKSNGEYYRANSSGKSGIEEPAFKKGSLIKDKGNLQWTDVGEGGSNQCTNINPSEPLLMNQVITIAIDMRKIPDATRDRFKVLNLNLTNQQGAPLNPTPIRPSLAASTATGSSLSGGPGGNLYAYGKKPSPPPRLPIYYLTWPNPLPGDTIPTVNVNLIYTPVASALLWKPGTFYPAGSVVISKDGHGPLATTNGHYYLALNSGMSSNSTPVSPPDFAAAAVPVPTFTDGLGIGWKDMGPMPAIAWQANTPFDSGALVFASPANRHYYKAQTNGTTGPRPPVFPTNGSEVKDGTLSWGDMGTIPRPLVWQDMGPMPTIVWKANTPFDSGARVFAIPDNGHYYRAQANGTTGPGAPRFPTDGGEVKDGNLSWEDMGPSPVAWQKNTNFASDVLVVPNPANGHYYKALTDGTTGSIQPDFPTDGTIVSDPEIGRKDMAPMPTIAWRANTTFHSGALVSASPENGHYYKAQNDGTTGSKPPLFPTDGSEVKDGDLRWEDMGPIPSPVVWREKTDFARGVFVVPKLANSHYYKAQTAQTKGTTGSIQPGFPTDGTIVADGPGLVWQNMGAAITPPFWKQNTAYAKGATVTPNPVNGHTYQAQSTGVSDKNSPPPFPVDAGGTVNDGTLSWKEIGPTPVIPAWQASTAFSIGAKVTPVPANGYYYEAQSDGVTGPNQPPFPPSGTVAEASNLVWVDSGATPPASLKNLKTWAPSTASFVGDVIQEAASGHYYSVVQAGMSGSTLPEFLVPAPEKVPENVTGSSNGPVIHWQDLGTTLPSSVSSLGTTPSDLTVNLLTYTLPQVHTLSYFNLAAGVVGSRIKTYSFVNTGTSTTPTWTSTTSLVTVDPILALTAYLKPMDAERPWQRSDLRPGLTLGISLTSPATNFYFGGSSEFPKLRNVQIVYGLSLYRVAILEAPYSSNTVKTRQALSLGPFIGLTFNITGFIQTLF